MNISADPITESAPNSRDNPCFSTDSTVAALNVCTDDERSYLLPYAQLLYVELIANPALERDSDAPSQRLLIRFVRAEVALFGSGLRSLERAIQKFELKFVKSIDRRYAAALKTHVAAVTITIMEETP